jgi:hypothetical protein
MSIKNPQPDQVRGPYPAHANHGYLDRSGYTTFDCITANKKVLNLGNNMSSVLRFNGLSTGGNLAAVTFSLGNSSAVSEYDLKDLPNKWPLGCTSITTLHHPELSEPGTRCTRLLYGTDLQCL